MQLSIFIIAFYKVLIYEKKILYNYSSNKIGYKNTLLGLHLFRVLEEM